MTKELNKQSPPLRDKQTWTKKDEIWTKLVVTHVSCVLGYILVVCIVVTQYLTIFIRVFEKNKK